MNENRIIQRITEGDKSAFEELFKLYENRIYNLALKWTGDPQDALDVSQEIFLRVYRYLPGFKNQSSFGTWIYRIAINVCRDAFSKKNENVLSLDGDEEYETQIPDLRYSPEIEFEKRQIKEVLKEAILSLDDSHKAVVIMRDINGMSYEEIAQALEINTGTVRSRLARAREKLRKKLAENGNFFEAGKSNNSEETSDKEGKQS